MNIVAINMSGKQLPVYDMDLNRIGTIYPYELFGLNYRAGGDGYAFFIVFRNSSGILIRDGMLIEPPAGALENAYKSKYRYGTVTIGGRTYSTFKMKRTENLYSVSGRKIGQVAAGQYVATVDDPSSGDTNPHWLQVYYARGTDGRWDSLAADGASYGFVNIGLEDGSMYNTVSCDGLWV
ncbi:hypothetical protein B1690_03125 [Geobacillus sp. 46C-IIa]|uniref:hypothetical protein n=1 Tax=Geobacillus sp. 46C-IIa TaxID=1963025 RepID=UPI0009BFFA93|nr:hypothetical protein [Geobacillus sp. 46C-IIa]OQP07535.1 hypothetical protein B1690_03125 [Geobacillus sp. 46C-IIa]QNU28301.1 hypothetical protein IC803_01595 [Geobacillus sp. 46C-IIa]